MPLERTGIPALIREAHAAIELGNSHAAYPLLHRAEGLAPSPAGWRAIGDAWHAAGNVAAGGTAHLRAARALVHDPELNAITRALETGALGEAERLLDARTPPPPSDIIVIRLRADLAARRGRDADAEKLLLQALALAPAFERGRYDLAACLHRQHRTDEALAEVDRLLADRPAQQTYRALREAIILIR